MIYTISANPSIDYAMDMSAPLELGITNRSVGERYSVGGKGINLSLVLKNLGVKSIALGFAAGFTGEKIVSELCKEGIENEFFRLASGESRTNVKIHSGGFETEINAAGPFVSEADMARLVDRIKNVQSGDVVVISGSLPRTDDGARSLYTDIAKAVRAAGADFVADVTGKTLLELLPLCPMLIKPNAQELCDIFGEGAADTADSVFECASALKEKGAKRVIVSAGARGAYMLTSDCERCFLPAIVPNGKKAVSTVGAGDSMVAGFLAALTRGMSEREAFLYGSAAASATVFSDGLATGEYTKELFELYSGSKES